MPAERRGDLWFGILLTVLSLAVLVEAWRMPRLDHLGVHPMSAPGLTPGLIGGVLAGLGVALVLRSLRERHAEKTLAAVADQVVHGDAAAALSWRRALLALALCLVYALGLLGRLPFAWATGLFVFTFVVAFSWPLARPWRTVGGALAMAMAVGIGVGLLFEQLFLVRLP